MQHCPYLLELFNHIPQDPELGLTPRGAYAFSLNVALLALRVVNQGFYKPTPKGGGLLTCCHLSRIRSLNCVLLRAIRVLFVHFAKERRPLLLMRSLRCSFPCILQCRIPGLPLKGIFLHMLLLRLLRPKLEYSVHLMHKDR